MSHAYCFLAEIKDSHFWRFFLPAEPLKNLFLAKRNEVFELPDEDKLTFLKEGMRF